MRQGPLIAPVVAGVLLLGCGAAPEPSQRPEPGAVQVTVTLPAATPATSCRGSEQRAIPALGSVISLSVLERERTAMDVLPDVTGGGYAWLPATTVLPGESRRVGSGASARRSICSRRWACERIGAASRIPPAATGLESV
jgi:hypothetical protein